jgi:hypothetical protein
LNFNEFVKDPYNNPLKEKPGIKINKGGRKIKEEI